MSDEKSCVVRIVNLDDTFTEESLKNFILINCLLEGNIKKIYLKQNYKLNLYYGYIIFDYSQDALKVVQTLNEYKYNSNQFQIDLIGPTLDYKKYKEIPRKPVTGHKFVKALTTLYSRSDQVLRLVRPIVGSNATANKLKTNNPSKLKSALITYAQVYITNLSDLTQTCDLTELLREFGPIEHTYMGVDSSNRSKQFAYVSFKFRTDATKAIAGLTGRFYKGLALKAVWA